MTWNWIQWTDRDEGATRRMERLRSDDGDDVMIGGDGWIEVDRAAVTLIASAPEMLALIERTYDPFGTGRIHDRITCPTCDEDREVDDPACLRARAAAILARLRERA